MNDTGLHRPPPSNVIPLPVLAGCYTGEFGKNCSETYRCFCAPCFAEKFPCGSGKVVGAERIEAFFSAFHAQGQLTDGLRKKTAHFAAIAETVALLCAQLLGEVCHGIPPAVRKPIAILLREVGKNIAQLRIRVGREGDHACNAAGKARVSLII